MTTKCFAILALGFAMASGPSASAFAGHRHHHHHQSERHHQPQSKRYVPADDDLISFLFGGPRYYDQQLFTTGAGPCAYERIRPDANATNKINDHYCGK